MAEILKGKPVADALVEQLRAKTDNMDRKPGLAIVRVGENPGDLSYERGAMKKAEAVGVQVRNVIFDVDISEAEVLAAIDELNNDEAIDGILIFRPLPSQIDDGKVREVLSPAKDMDGITDGAMAGVFMNAEIGYPPCTAEAVIELLDYYGIDPKGKKVAVTGRSLVIGRPVAMMLMHRNATISICHTRTEIEDLIDICQNADIIVTCVGKAGFLTEELVSEDQIVLDVGINVDENGKLCGDTAFEEVEGIVEGITPVPGGIGAITSALLMKHVVTAAERKIR